MTKKLLFLPGLACTSSTFDLLLQNLLDYKCTTVEWPIHKVKDFQRLDDFRDFLLSEKNEIFNDSDAIIGHSMGGLVALKLAEENNYIKKTIMIDSFLIKPSPFFQNLIQGNRPDLYKQVISLLNKNTPYYSQSLIEHLKHKDAICEFNIDNIKNVHILYGMRAANDVKKVKANLHWPLELFRKINLEFFNGTSHFLMMEEPEVTANAIRQII